MREVPVFVLFGLLQILNVTSVAMKNKGRVKKTGNSGTHAVPVQRRMAPTSPTAQPSLLPTINTEFKNSAVGLVTLLQSVPSQWMMAPKPLTAHPSELLTMKTEFKLPDTFDAGFVTSLQIVPFQWATAPMGFCSFL